MNSQSQKAKDIFVELIGNVPPEEWEDRLVEASGGDQELLIRVRALLRAHAEPGSFLEEPAVANQPDPTIDQPITEKPGTQIGPYKLLQQVGEGGMGVVYMAEQKEPVKRRVALKIIKLGMDTRQVIARFEAERQALAMMDHPNIAKVLDAGQTESGRPFFVMELVKGVPVTQYCDEQHLTPKERLELFVPICQAVQHAHQKGIIHRDIKPSNILIALFDGQPVCKVIDFGVAKATNQTLTEKTMFTQLGQVVGTLEYMSPEQAQVNQLDIDTRSDVYSLGVLLYELLTGDTPFDRTRLRSAAFDEMLRIIREEEPPKPSTKISSSEALPSIAANRHVDPQRLTSSVRGELDWIVMKALEKDRARRYETASKFAEDVQHYLNDEPVAANPPSVIYRFKKFARRNKAVLATMALVVTVLAVVTVQSLLMARNASERARRQIEVNQEIGAALSEVDRLRRQAEQAGMDDREAWSATEKAAERARGLAANDLATAKSVDQVKEALASLEQAQRDRRVFATLESLRDKLGGDGSMTSFIVGAKSPLPDPGYARAFSDWGINPQSTKPTAVAELIRGCSRELRESMVIALDVWTRYYAHWTSRCSEDQKTEQKWVEDVLSALEDDAWRRRLRRTKDPIELLELADDPAVEGQPPHALLVLASRLQLQHRNTAIELLERGQLKYPDDYWLNLRLSGYLRSSAPADSLRFAGIAVALRPRDPEALSQLGASFEATERLSEATVTYRRVLDFERDKFRRHETYVRLGGVLDQQGGVDAAIDAYRRGAAALPASEIEHWNPGNAYKSVFGLLKRLQRLDELVQFLNESIEASSAQAELHYLLAQALVEREDWGRAATTMTRVRELNDGKISWRAAAFHCELLINAGRADEAKSAARDFCTKRETLIAPWASTELVFPAPRYTVQFRKDGLPVEVEWMERVRRIVELLPNDAGVRNVFAGFLIPDELFHKTLASIDRQALAASLPGNRYEQAEQLLREACDLDVDNYAARYNHAFVLGKLGRHEEAIEQYCIAAQLKPTSSTIQWHLGESLRTLNRHEDAVAPLRKSLDLAKSNYQRTVLAFGTKPFDYKQHYPMPEWCDGVFEALVDSLSKLGRQKDAIYAYQDYIAWNPLQLRRDSDTYRLRSKLGILLKSEGRLDEAEAQFLKCIDLRPSLGAAPLELARLYVARKEAKRALDLLNQRGEESWLPWRAVLLTELNRIDDAVACYQKLKVGARLGGANPFWVAENCSKLAWRLATSPRHRDRDPSVAVRIARLAVTLAPDNAPHWTNFGNILRKTGDSNGAIDAYARAIALRDDGGGPHNMLGLALRVTGDEEAAIESFQNAVDYLSGVCEQTPNKQRPRKNLRIALVNLGDTLSILKRPDEATTSFVKAIELDPKRPLVHNKLGLALQAQGRLDEAIDCFEKASELDPTQVAFPHNLANALAKKGAWKEAINALRQRMKLAPHDPWSLNNLAWHLATASDTDARDPKEALELARRAVKMDAKPWHFWNTLSVAAFRAKEWKESLAAREEKNRRTPVVIEDKLFLAMTHWRIGDEAEARKWLDEAVAELDQNEEPDAKLLALRREAETLLGVADGDESYCQLGMALNGSKRYGDAETFYRRALQVCQELAEGADDSLANHLDLVRLRFGLGNALKAQGKTAEVREVARQALSLPDGLPQDSSEVGQMRISAQELMQTKDSAHKDSAEAIGVGSPK